MCIRDSIYIIQIFYSDKMGNANRIELSTDIYINPIKCNWCNGTEEFCMSPCQNCPFSRGYLAPKQRQCSWCSSTGYIVMNNCQECNKSTSYSNRKWISSIRNWWISTSRCDTGKTNLFTPVIVHIILCLCFNLYTSYVNDNMQGYSWGWQSSASIFF